MNILEKKSVAGVFLKPSSDIKDDYFKIVDTFKKYGIELILEETSAEMIGENGFKIKELCEKSDFLISIGGDGTLLSLVRNTFMYKKPVLGIHLGTLGFLTDIQLPDLNKFLDNFIDNKFKIQDRMIIKIEVGFNTFYAFNDLVISRKTISSMVRVDGKINGKYFNSYYGDGIIISTPNGSTAYNLSVGGPIVYPLSETFIITPIAPHSLTQRPIVVPSDFEFEFKIPQKNGAILIVDGQDIYEVEENQAIKISVASIKAKMIHRLERNFFQVLNEKLAWGD